MNVHIANVNNKLIEVHKKGLCAWYAGKTLQLEGERGIPEVKVGSTLTMRFSETGMDDSNIIWPWAELDALPMAMARTLAYFDIEQCEQIFSVSALLPFAEWLMKAGDKALYPLDHVYFIEVDGVSYAFSTNGSRLHVVELREHIATLCARGSGVPIDYLKALLATAPSPIQALYVVKCKNVDQDMFCWMAVANDAIGLSYISALQTGPNVQSFISEVDMNGALSEPYNLPYDKKTWRNIAATARKANKHGAKYLVGFKKNRNVELVNSETVNPEEFDMLFDIQYLADCIDDPKQWTLCLCRQYGTGDFYRLQGFANDRRRSVALMPVCVS